MKSAYSCGVFLSCSGYHGYIIMSLQFPGRGPVLVHTLLYLLLPVQTFVHVITIEPLFRFISILARFMAVSCKLPNRILVNFGCDLDLEFSRSNIQFTVPQHKMVRLPWNEKQPNWLNARPQMSPSILTLAMTLTLNFGGQIFNLLYWNKNGPIITKQKTSIWIEC